MTFEINETHDQDLKSWVESANAPDTDFPLQNLPVCSYRRKDTDEFVRLGVPIGDQIFDLSLADQARLFDSEGGALPIYTEGEATLNILEVFDFESIESNAFRSRMQKLFGEDADEETKATISRCLTPLAESEFFLPFEIADYTDFYCSIYHATNVGKLFR
ncbi:MAG: fumarylacetoacetase, partial [Acidobacteria bacterium]|nr:fumarylacetoacetase [Acidobacteriota bacterium]